MSQKSLGLETPKIDVSRFVQWSPSPEPQRVILAGERARRRAGLALGIIGLKHAGGYEVVVQFDDGKIESCHPMNLLPDLENSA